MPTCRTSFIFREQVIHAPSCLRSRRGGPSTPPSPSGDRSYSACRREARRARLPLDGAPDAFHHHVRTPHGADCGRSGRVAAQDLGGDGSCAGRQRNGPAGGGHLRGGNGGGGNGGVGGGSAGSGGGGGSGGDGSQAALAGAAWSCTPPLPCGRTTDRSAAAVARPLAFAGVGTLLPCDCNPRLPCLRIGVASRRCRRRRVPPPRWLHVMARWRHAGCRA